MAEARQTGEGFVPIGERIALIRRRRGLSQVKLAGLLGRSESWISQIERGAKPLERMGTIAELARVLDVPVSELMGTPPRVVRDPTEQHRAVEEIRITLSAFDFLSLLLRPRAETSVSAADMADMRAKVDRAWQLAHASDYTSLAPLFSSLLAEGERMAHATDGDRRAEVFELLAHSYQAVAAVMTKLGETELAWVAGERSMMAAERAGSPLLTVAGVFRLALGFVSAWRVDRAERVASSGALLVASQLTDGTPEGVS